MVRVVVRATRHVLSTTLTLSRADLVKAKEKEEAAEAAEKEGSGEELKLMPAVKPEEKSKVEEDEDDLPAEWSDS